MNRTPTRAAIVLFFLLGIATRLPFVNLYCRPGDMGNFVLAMEQIDLPAGNPQMPGMFLVFIFLGRLFDVVFNDPVVSLAAVSILASGLAAVLLYYLGTVAFGRLEGLVAGSLAITSPLVWYQGGLGLSHMSEFCWVAVILTAAYWTGLGDRKALFLLGFAMGFAGGIRPSTPFFLAPVAFFATFRGIGTKRFGWGDFGGAFALGLGAIALWFVPLIAAAGGWPEYWRLVQNWLPLHTER